jgi:hypothetical protein
MTKVIALPPPEIPQNLLSLNEAPSRPMAGATQKNVALIIADFQEALGACNADKAAIAAITGHR